MSKQEIKEDQTRALSCNRLYDCMTLAPKIY